MKREDQQTMTQAERLKLKYQNIFKKYQKLDKENINGKPLYRHSAICEMLSQEFYLSSDYIADIILKEQALQDQKAA